jgi:N,N'-diacetylchitobiose transport system permease protein
LTDLDWDEVEAPPGKGDVPPRPRRRGRWLPYVLVAPALATLVVMLGWPLVRLVQLALQRFGLRQQFGAPAEWVGLDNFATIFGDDEFWRVLVRTLVLCAVTVVLTMTIGVLIALLMERLGRVMRLAVSVALLLAWAMPGLAATVVWQWLFDTQYGLINWLLTTLRIGEFQGHSWLSAPLSFFAVATVIVVWMGVPFVAFTTYAGLTQVPSDIVEAAHIDGANAWQIFRNVTVPMIRPILYVLTALSVLWDVRVFTQIYVLQKAGGLTRETNVLGVYAYRISFGENQFDVGAAVAIVTVGVTLVLTAAHLRQMLKQVDR